MISNPVVFAGSTSLETVKVTTGLVSHGCAMTVKDGELSTVNLLSNSSYDVIKGSIIVAYGDYGNMSSGNISEMLTLYQHNNRSTTLYAWVITGDATIGFVGNSGGGIG